MQTLHEAKTAFISHAQAAGIAVLYAGPRHLCPDAAMQAWAMAAQQRAAARYGRVDEALAAQIYLKD